MGERSRRAIERLKNHQTDEEEAARIHASLPQLREDADVIAVSIRRPEDVKRRQEEKKKEKAEEG